MYFIKKTQTPTSTVYELQHHVLAKIVVVVLILLYLFLPRFLSSATISFTQFSVPDLLILTALYVALEGYSLFSDYRNAENYGRRVTETGSWLEGNKKFEIEN